MESPPSTSIWSEDSGLLLTSGSISSGSMSGESRSGFGQLPFEYQDSDCEKSLSQADSLDGMSDIICGEHFNTLKKGPHWNEAKSSPIEPPLEFQDRPNVYDAYAENLLDSLFQEAMSAFLKKYARLKLNALNLQVFRPIHQVLQRTYWTPDFLPFSPCHGGRPSSRSSLGSSRLSSSHNSLSVATAHRVDDSSFITQAVSHDTLSTNQISDLYNVPFDSDVYAVPVDTVRPPVRPRRNLQPKKRRRNTSSGFRELERHEVRQSTSKKNLKSDHISLCSTNGKRHSVAGTSTTSDTEPVHMTLQEVRQYLQTLYSSSSDSSEHNKNNKTRSSVLISKNINNNKYADTSVVVKTNNANVQRKKSAFLINIKTKKVKDSCDSINKRPINVKREKPTAKKKSPAKVFSLKQTLCNMFRFRKIISPERRKLKEHETDDELNSSEHNESQHEVNKNMVQRALPPLPGQKREGVHSASVTDFATSIHRVKDYGWYWGPLSSEGAEKILSNEPDGSFIVRDSSDDHYIFSLTFKLNNTVRHVRIEHDQGNFSFGCCTKFKSQTIIEFIENAVEHSRSGRYLFFLHRRPTIGPVRVQLLHPVSRFKQIQSLQHMCRFVILKEVRKDLISSLPLPRRMIDYLSTPQYYSEHLIDVEDAGGDERRPQEDWSSSNEASEEPTTRQS